MPNPTALKSLRYAVNSPLSFVIPSGGSINIADGASLTFGTLTDGVGWAELHGDETNGLVFDQIGPSIFTLGLKSDLGGTVGIIQLSDGTDAPFGVIAGNGGGVAFLGAGSAAGIYLEDEVTNKLHLYADSVLGFNFTQNNPIACGGLYIGNQNNVSRPSVNEIRGNNGDTAEPDDVILMSQGSTGAQLNGSDIAVYPIAIARAIFDATGSTGVTVSDPNVTVNSTFAFGMVTPAGTITGSPYVVSIVPGTEFTVKASALDTSTWNYSIIN